MAKQNKPEMAPFTVEGAILLRVLADVPGGSGCVHNLRWLPLLFNALAVLCISAKIYGSSEEDFVDIHQGISLKKVVKSGMITLLHNLFTKSCRRAGEKERNVVSQLSEKVIQGLKRSYSAYFDIEEVEDGTPLKARCAYHMRDSQYVLVKKAELWAAECHEYLYLWDAGHLDSAAVDEIFRRTLEDGGARVKPHAQHMYTYLTAVALYDSAQPDALAQLKKLKKRREYKLSLHGWMEFRIAAVDLSTGEITVNRAGKALAKDLKRLTDRIISANQIGEEKTQ